MLCIGVFGSHLGEKAMHSIIRFYARQQSIKTYPLFKCNKAEFFQTYQNSIKNSGVFLVLLNEETSFYCKTYGVRFDIFLYLQASSVEETENLVKEDGIIILNSDDHKILPIKTNSEKRIITCGLNSKANVTISSVSESILLEQIQCCVQETIHTISGMQLEPQEFAVQVDNEDKSVSGVLAAVTALMAGDVEISIIADVP